VRSDGETVIFGAGTPFEKFVLWVRAGCITMHGFANVNADASYFTNIIPCGIHE
jgi:hypothetical protein